MAESEAPTTPGAMIAAARRQRGLTPDDLAERTKIPAGLLAALEADEYHRLSGPLYARSFLRACAAELALDVAEVFAAYERQVGGPQREPSAAAAPPAVRIRRVGLPWGRLAAGGLVLAAAVLLTLRLAGPRGATGPAPAGEAGADAPREPARAAMGQATDAGSAEAVTGPGGPGGAPRAAPAGLPDLVFSDGRTWPLVARLRLERRAAVRSRSDGEPGFTPVANGRRPARRPPRRRQASWPESPTPTAPATSSTGESRSASIWRWTTGPVAR
ncbi:helix-turn-helix domain-containing protein [bacterium]|nr:helix-turn-helix domain-containing protein [bacterium]